MIFLEHNFFIANFVCRECMVYMYMYICHIKVIFIMFNIYFTILYNQKSYTIYKDSIYGVFKN